MVMQITKLAQTLAQASPTQKDVELKRQMKESWDAYRGNFPDPLAVQSNQPNDNMKSNRCRMIVDKGVSFLFGAVLKIDGPDADEVTQDFLSHLWGDDDDRMTLLANAAINGGVCGQVFLKFIPPQGTMKYPRIVVLDPMNVRIITMPDDCDCVLAYIIEYPGVGNVQNKQIIARVDPDNLAEIAGYEELDDYWTITNYQRRSASLSQYEQWNQVGQPEEWLYPFAPIFSCQNLPNPNEPWGTPDLTNDIIEENKSLNFLQSNLARIIKYHAHPITFAVGVNASTLQTNVDGVLCLPDPSSKLEKLAAMENFSGIQQVLSMVRDNMDEQSRVPAVALGRIESLPRGTISGVALELLFAPLIEKTIQKRRLYGKLIREVSRAALCHCGFISIEDYEDYDIELKWMNLLPIDNKEASETALNLLQLGVSQETILQQLGYNPEDEAQKVEEHPLKTAIPQKNTANNNQAITTENQGAKQDAASENA